MENYFALWSMVFMISFVVLFDGFHQRKRLCRLFSSVHLMSQDELNQLQTIWAACQD